MLVSRGMNKTAVASERIQDMIAEILRWQILVEQVERIDRGRIEITFSGDSVKSSLVLFSEN